MSDSTTPKLLIVDDDPQAIRLLSAVLQDMGEVRFASAGAEALRRIEGNRPDLVLLDGEMPGMDGFATCVAIHALPGCAEIPVIFVTAYSDPESETRALGLGAVDFIHKPISPSIVRARVSTHLALMRRTEEVRQANRRLEAKVAGRTAELRLALTQAQSAERTKAEFLSNMSHEFRTPMHAILAFSQIGLKRTAGDEAHKKLHGLLQHIRGSAERLQELVDDLMSLASLSSGRHPFIFQPTDLVRVCSAQLELFTAKAAGKGIHLQLQGPSELKVRCDAQQIGLVIRHLLANALQFSPVGGKVVLLLETAATACSVAVSDEGPGIPESEREAVFQSFVQGSHTKTGAGGKGMGLAISRFIVAAHGGRIHIAQAVGGGAQIQLRLPLS